VADRITGIAEGRFYMPAHSLIFIIFPLTSVILWPATLGATLA